MDFIVGILLSTRFFTFLSGGLAPHELHAFFAPPQIVVVSEKVLVNCRLENAFPKELVALVQSATPVLLYVTLELRDVKGREPVTAKVEESVLSYDLAAKRFSVAHSRAIEPLAFSTLDSAVAAAGSFLNVPLGTLGQIAADREYQLVIYAVLGKTRVEALDNKEIDLMYYWDYKRPMIKTEKFRGGELINLRVQGK